MTTKLKSGFKGQNSSVRCSITKHMNATLGEDFLFLFLISSVKAGSVFAVISEDLSLTIKPDKSRIQSQLFVSCSGAVGSGEENAYQLLWEIKRCAYAKISAARPLPSATTTGTAGFLVTDSKTVRMVLGPPSRTSSTTGTPWVRSVKPTVVERTSTRIFSVSISRYFCRDWNYSTHSHSYQHLSSFYENWRAW